MENWKWAITILLIPFFTWLWNYISGERKGLKADLAALKKEVEGYKKRELEMSTLIFEHLDMINELKREIRDLKSKTR